MYILTFRVYHFKITTPPGGMMSKHGHKFYNYSVLLTESVTMETAHDMSSGMFEGLKHTSV